MPKKIKRAWKRAPENVSWALKGGKRKLKSAISKPIERQKKFRAKTTIKSVGADKNPAHPYWRQHPEHRKYLDQ